MAIYDPKSRYARTPSYRVVDRHGRQVTVTEVPPLAHQPIAGWHVHRQGQRPDHLAAHYLDDAAGAWRIADANGSMQMEWLSEQVEIAIPVKGR